MNDMLYISIMRTQIAKVEYKVSNNEVKISLNLIFSDEMEYILSYDMR